MAVMTSKQGTLALQTEGPSPAEAAPGLLLRLRAAWAAHLAENKRGWDEVVKAQADDPSLD